MTRHAIQQFQEGFSSKPKPVPVPEPPEWGHIERAADLVAQMDEKQRRFNERQARKGSPAPD